MSYLVGVDVGASHIEAAIALDAVEPLERLRRPGDFVKPGRISTVAESVSSTIRKLTQKVGTSDAPECVVVGAAGAHNESLTRELENGLKSVFSTTTIQVTTDGAIALEAAFSDAAGIVVCAGSGSIAYARTRAAEIKRVGGLGPELADEGSGYAIGRAGLRAAARAYDGRRPSTSLVESISEAVGITSLNELVDWAWEAERPTIAALSEVVCRDAISGDDVAGQIVRDAALDLGALIDSLAVLFDLYAKFDIAFSGGVLRAESPVRWELVKHLRDRHPNATLNEQTVDPVHGALVLANRLRS